MIESRWQEKLAKPTKNGGGLLDVREEGRKLERNPPLQSPQIFGTVD